MNKDVEEIGRTGGGRQVGEGQGDVGAKGSGWRLSEISINRYEINLSVTDYYPDHLML